LLLFAESLSVILVMEYCVILYTEKNGLIKPPLTYLFSQSIRSVCPICRFPQSFG